MQRNDVGARHERIEIDEFLGSMDRLAGMYQRLKQDDSIPRMAMFAIGAGRDRVAARV